MEVSGVGEEKQELVASAVESMVGEVARVAAIVEKGVPRGFYQYPAGNEGFEAEMISQFQRARWTAIEGPDFAARSEFQGLKPRADADVDLEKLPTGTKVLVSGRSHQTESWCLQLVESATPSAPRLLRVSNFRGSVCFLGPIASVTSTFEDNRVAFPRSVISGGLVGLPYFDDAKVGPPGIWECVVGSVVVKYPDPPKGS